VIRESASASRSLRVVVAMQKNNRCRASIRLCPRWT
jgi:hypothetical protein